MNVDKIHLKLTAQLERAAGTGEAEVDCESKQSLGIILARLTKIYPETTAILGQTCQLELSQGALPPGLLVIRDSTVIPARLETTVSAGDRLTLMLMISGG
jgi:ThiS family.